MVLMQMLQSLEQKKRETAQELQMLNQNLRDEASGAAGVAVSDLIPADTDVSGVLQPNCQALCLDLRLKTNNHCVIKGAIVFAEHLFSGESTFVHPGKADKKLDIPLKPEKDCAIEMLIKVLASADRHLIAGVADVAATPHVACWAEPSVHDRLCLAC